MRLLITAVVDGNPVDLAIDAEDDARVGDVATAVVERFPRAAAPAMAAEGGAPTLRVVGASSTTTTAPPAPPLYLGDRRLDPQEPLSVSPLRHGSVVGVGEPVAAVLAEPPGLVEVRYVGGANAGKVLRFDPGEYSVGSGAGADVPLPDPELPDVCAYVIVNVDGTVELEPAREAVDRTRPAPRRTRPLDGPIVLGTRTRKVAKKPKAGEPLPEGTVTVLAEDDVPLVHRDRTPVTERTRWEPGETCVIGDELLEVRRAEPPDAALSPNPAGGTLDFNRPPRLLPPQRETQFTLPQEPKEVDKAPFPLLMIILPMIAGSAMFYFTRSPYSLIFIAMGPMMALGNYVQNKRQGRRRYRKELAQYFERTERIQKQALAALTEERAARRRDFADPAEVLMTAIGPRARMWERRQTDPDFLLVRVGTADQPSEVRIKDPAREDHEGDLVWTAPDVPVVVPVAEAGVTGVAGPTDTRMGVVRWILGQVAVLHSPADVDMVLLSSAANEEHWRWVRWLPHMRADVGDSEIAHIGVDEQSIGRRIGELHREMERRQAASKNAAGIGGQGAVPFPPLLVVLDGARGMRLLPGVPELLQGGPRVRMYFLCLDADERLLPEECQAIVDAVPGRTSVRFTGKPTVEGVRPDLLSVSWAERIARALAPIRDVSDVAVGGSMPTSSRLLDVLRLDPVTSEGIQQRWASVGRTTEAVVGEGAEGVVSIDMSRDGPHGLVAGTTGSGKSELLQTIIASLAVNNRPDEMNYVLVDYKGGAAFKDCNNLPHTVGMVTDLDGHLTTRALESLGAELRRREHQLAAADAKDIEDYLAAKGPDDEPMPRLLIVIDEFAALVAELPDFVTGLVDIARRGRSLGVHLILATQRPQGVVTPEIKSNTNLRIALRVTDEGDSQDIIEAKEAAHISKSTPGRGYARLGHSSLIPFQSSRVGGRPRGEDAPAQIEVRTVDFETLGTPVVKQTGGEEEDVSIPTDLAALVTAAREASAASGVTAPPSPWLPALPEVVTLDEILTEFPAATPSEGRLQVPFGLVDVPSEQRRDVAVLDIERGSHLSVVGAPRSGRSAALRALAGSIARYTSPEDVHIYGVDCGNNALLPLVGLPHTGAVVTRDQTDRMDRMLNRFRAVISQRQQDLATGGFADVAEQRANVPPHKRMPYLVVLFDRWEGFYQAYESLDAGRYVAAWQQVIQEGGAVGIRIVLSGDRSLTMGRIGSMFDDKLMMRMIDPSDFQSIGMRAKEVPSSIADGRGFRAEGLRETQVALLSDDPAGTAQVAALQEIGREAKARYADVPTERLPFRLDVLPLRIELDEADQLPGPEREESTLVVGVGGDNLSLRTLDAFEHGPGMLVAGPRRSGRSTVLRTMAAYALRDGWEVVVVTPRQSPLRDLAGHDRVHGPFDESHRESELEELLEKLRAGESRLLTFVDDVELAIGDSWIGDVLSDHLDKIRDSGHVLAAAGTSGDLSSVYRGLVANLKKSGSGVLLSPQSSSDPDLYGTQLPRSVYGASLPPGGGYLMRSGRPPERIQVIWPG